MIFQTQKNTMSSSPPKRTKLVQTYLDLGQRVFDTTQCPLCSMVYTKGKEDSKHKRFCAKTTNTTKWKLDPAVEDVVMEDGDITILVVSDLPKLKRICDIVNLELGYTSEDATKAELTRFLLLIKQQVVGFLEVDSTVDIIAFALPKDSNTACKLQPSTVEFGVKKIWIHSQHRLQGLGTKLLDAARIHLGYPSAIKKSQVAFSQPSTMGRQFATRYFCQDTILVYNI